MKTYSQFDISTHLHSRKLIDIVENRTAYTLDTAELTIYETHQTAEKVELVFDNPLLASMITGKKVMHLEATPAFDFWPGESVIVPSGQTMHIDFPEATRENPTQCLALAIAPTKIKGIVDTLNEKSPLIDTPQGWQFANDNFYFTNETAVNQLLSRLIFIFTENNISKDYFANLVLQELVVRLMQTKARKILNSDLQALSHNNRLAFAAKYVQDNIHKNLTVKELADKACMSEPNFFKVFKHQYGITPVEYINQQRIHLAMKLLQNTQYPISDIGFACGYNNLNYFLKVFKKTIGVTPMSYRRNLVVF
jgi:AraC family transcriptional regulator